MVTCSHVAGLLPEPYGILRLQSAKHLRFPLASQTPAVPQNLILTDRNDGRRAEPILFLALLGAPEKEDESMGRDSII